MASISGKLSNKAPIIIFQMLLAGRRIHNKKKHFFMGSREFYEFNYGKSKYYGLGLWGGIRLVI
jgi:hypothetical protein